MGKIHPIQAFSNTNTFSCSEQIVPPAEPGLKVRGPSSRCTWIIDGSP